MCLINVILFLLPVVYRSNFNFRHLTMTIPHPSDQPPLPELMRFFYIYNIDKTLFSNCFNSVAVGHCIKTKRPVIIKAVYNNRRQFNKEVTLLKKLKHVQGVVRFVDSFSLDNGHMIVTEHFGDMNLYRFLQNAAPITENVIHTVIKQLVVTIQTFFKHRILHRKIKPSNILLDLKNLRIKIINLNAACRFDRPDDVFKTPMCEDIAPPEYFLFETITADSLYVWSIGLVMYEMLFNRKPFNSKTEVVRKTLSVVSSTPISEHAVNLVSWMLSKDPKQRITLKQCLHHPWLSKKYI